jgi:hypothetical protein
MAEMAVANVGLAKHGKKRSCEHRTSEGPPWLKPSDDGLVVIVNQIGELSKAHTDVSERRPGAFRRQKGERLALLVLGTYSKGVGTHLGFDVLILPLVQADTGFHQ